MLTDMASPDASSQSFRNTSKRSASRKSGLTTRIGLLSLHNSYFFEILSAIKVDKLIKSRYFSRITNEEAI